MSETTIYTDGACSGNPGPGGWGAVILTPDGRVRELGGGEPRTTNNRMELRAAIEALAAVQDQEGPVALYTDSTYVIAGITKWAGRWKRNGWLRADGGEVLNRDFWEGLQAALSVRGASGVVEWRYVRGHSGSPGNERADAIAVSFAQGVSPKLYDGLLIGYCLDLSASPSGTRQEASVFYLSLVGGKLERHATWSECEARVKGKPGARFKKVRSAAEEKETLRRWGFTGL